MSTSSGPHIIRESLAFGYDTGYGLTNRGIATRFCKGEPTTNIWYDSYGQDINTRSDFQAPMQSTAGLNQSVRSETWNGNRIWQLDRTAGSAGTYDSWRRCVDTSVSNNYGSTRYVSIKICLPFGGSISELALHTGGGNGSHNSSHFTKIPLSDVPSDAPFKDSWYHFLASANWSSTTTGHCVGLAFKSGNATTFLATEPMYYNSEGNIPFTSTSRGHLNTLFDLASRSFISTTNASYDDDGMLAFDGTDDYILATDTQYSTTQTWTVDSIINPTDTSDGSWNAIFGGGLSQGGYFMFHGSGQLTYYEGYINSGTRIKYFGKYLGTDFPQDTFTHLSIRYNGDSTYDIFINGSKSSYSYTFESTYSLKLTRVGAADSRYGSVKIPVFKFYETNLTDEQILQNYKSYKNRFNL